MRRILALLALTFAPTLTACDYEDVIDTGSIMDSSREDSDISDVDLPDEACPEDPPPEEDADVEDEDQEGSPFSTGRECPEEGCPCGLEPEEAEAEVDAEDPEELELLD